MASKKEVVYSVASKKAEVVYRYSVEIAQQAYVFGQIREPDEEVVQFVEDIVRSQVSEIVLQARALAARRGARFLAVEDLIFLIRHDRAKVNRLRTYLSWKDVRKKVKESEADETPEIDTTEEPSTALKAHKMRVKIPWEVTSTFSEYLKEDSEGEDDDEIEAYEDSKKRLKDADDLTRTMNKEQYQHYAECRQASFTYRKVKRFREFVNMGAYMEGNANDEVMDVLGFLSYEMVRSLCEAGSLNKRTLAASRAVAAVTALKEELKKEELKSNSAAKGKGREKKRAADDAAEAEGEKDDPMSTPAETTSSSRTTREGSQAAKKGRKGDPNAPPRSPPRHLLEPTSLFSEPPMGFLPSGMTTPGGQLVTIAGAGNMSAMDGAPEKESLGVQDVNGGYVAMQQGQASLKSSGMRNWRGGLKRVRVGFI